MSKHIFQTSVNFKLMLFHTNLFHFNFCGENEETFNSSRTKEMVHERKLIVLSLSGQFMYTRLNISKKFSYCPQNWIICFLWISEQTAVVSLYTDLTFWRWNFFFLILAHPVYKMWIIQEPNTLELWNKLHFEKEKTESICHV